MLILYSQWQTEHLEKYHLDWEKIRTWAVVGHDQEELRLSVIDHPHRKS